MTNSKKHLNDIIERENIKNLESHIDYGNTALRYGGWGSIAGASYAIGRYTPAYIGFWGWLGNSYSAIADNFGIVAKASGYGFLIGAAVYAATRLFKWFRKRRAERRQPA